MRRHGTATTHYLDVWANNTQDTTIKLRTDDEGAARAFAAMLGVAREICPDADRVTVQRAGEYGEYALDAAVG